jgi:hypothetical protein
LAKYSLREVLDREDFDHRNKWYVAEEYGIEGGRIVVRSADSVARTHPLKDPGLFSSFARLGGLKTLSRPSVLRWVAKYGLLKRRDETKPYSYRSRFLNQASMSLDEFKEEARLAHSASRLYRDLNQGDATTLKMRLAGLKEESGKSKRRLSTLDQKLISLWEEELHQSRPVNPNRLMLTTSEFETFVKRKVGGVRLSVWNSDPFPDGAPTRAYEAQQSWDCPDLLSAVYLQFYFIVTRALPTRYCENPRCGIAFQAKGNKRFCSDGCRSSGRTSRQPRAY